MQDLSNKYYVYFNLVDNIKHYDAFVAEMKALYPNIIATKIGTKNPTYVFIYFNTAGECDAIKNDVTGGVYNKYLNPLYKGELEF